MGDGGAGKAQRAAEKAEQQRQFDIRKSIAGIDAAFDSPGRESQYDDYIKAVRERLTGDANRQKAMADRRLRFSMARQGLTGGSAQVDANRTLGEDFSQGLLEAERRAQGAGSDLRSQDEQTRMNLIQLAQSGLDSTTAAQRAGAAMRASADTARGGAFAEGLGDIFGSTADIYRRQEDAAARRKGAADVQAGLYGNSRTGY